MGQKMKIPFFKLSLGKREIDEVIRVVHGGYMTQGYETRRLEEEFKAYVGAKYAIGVDSCTNGLFLSLKYNGIGVGDEVGIPSMTFASVANVVLQCGANIDWQDEIHVGFAYQLKNNRAFRVVDSAHQIDWGVYRDFSDSLMNFSFYPTKQISSAEGGMICTNDHYAMEWFEKARWHGRKGGGFNYSIDFPGYKFNMTDVQAVIARVQLEKLDRMNRQRKHVVSYYNKELGLHNESLHLYTIDMENRDEFIKFMDGRGINCSVHFYNPLHTQPAYKEFNVKDLPLTTEKARTTVSLPLYPDMCKEEVDYVINAIKEWNNGQRS